METHTSAQCYKWGGHYPVINIPYRVKTKIIYYVTDCILILFWNLSLSATSRTNVYIHLAVSHSFVERDILILRKDCISKFGNRNLFPRSDIHCLVRCVSASLTIWTSDHPYWFTTTRAVIGTIPCTY